MSCGEATALDKLNAKQRAEYEAVKKVCEKANDPVAQLSLQKLLMEGSLPGEKDLKGGGNVLDNLSKLATSTTLAKGIDRSQLLTDVVQELATPSAISQGAIGSRVPHRRRPRDPPTLARDAFRARRPPRLAFRLSRQLHRHRRRPQRR